MACLSRDLAQCLAFGRPYRLNRAALDQQSYDLFTAARNGVGQRSVPCFSTPGKQSLVAENPVQSCGVFFQDGFDALRHVVLDRLDDVDRPAQNQVAGFFVAA